MGTGVLAIALCPELVALVTRPADSPADGARGTSGPRGTPVGMLAVLLLGPGAGEMGVVDADVLLELLEGVVGPLGKIVETAVVEVAVGHVPVGEEGVLGDVVGGEAVERVGQHRDCGNI